MLVRSQPATEGACAFQSTSAARQLFVCQAVGQALLMRHCMRLPAQDRRKEMGKLVSKLGEEGKVAIRCALCTITLLLQCTS